MVSFRAADPYSRAGELGARSVTLPAIMPIFVTAALDSADWTANNPQIRFPYINSNEPVDDTAFPAISSLYAIYAAASLEMNDAAQLGAILTDGQVENLYTNSDVIAASPDHHYKSNFTTTYPVFVLGIIYELARFGQVQAPRSTAEALALAQDPVIHPILYDGMVTAAGFWKQGFGTKPQSVFDSSREEYPQGESPFVRDETAVWRLRPEIIVRLRKELKLRNQGDRVSVKCPVAFTSIEAISTDPASPRYLSQEQLEQLTSKNADSNALATKNEHGGLNLEYDILESLRQFFGTYATNYLHRYGTPVLHARRHWPHASTIRHIAADALVPHEIAGTVRDECPTTRQRSAQACICAE